MKHIKSILKQVYTELFKESFEIILTNKSNHNINKQ